MSNSKIIRVHGTFASAFGRSRDDERKWHEGSSEFSEWLKENGQNFDLADDFNWSGENFESARIHAAEELLERIKNYEKQSQPYHIISHSHGGAVVWNAIRLSEMRRWREKICPDIKKGEPVLANLKSWVTVGTPFLKSSRSWKGEIGAALIQLLLLWVIWQGGKYGIAEISEVLKNTDLQRELIFVWHSICFFLAALFIAQAPVISFMSLNSSKNYRKLTHKYMAKWFDIRSEKDEAIFGLKHALSLNANFVEHYTPRDVPHMWKPASYMRNWMFWPFRLIFNTIVVPLGNSYVRGRLKRVALGDDEPLYRVKSIEPSPLGKEIDMGVLPIHIDEELVRKANDSLKEYIPNLRESLAAGVTSAGSTQMDISFNVAASKFEGSELVHTSYFENEEIRRIIMSNILVSEKLQALSDSAGEYVNDFHTELDIQLSNIEDKVDYWRILPYLPLIFTFIAVAIYLTYVLTFFLS